MPWLFLALWGCDPAHHADAPRCDGGESQAALVRELTFLRATDGVSEGFDLDGAITDAGDTTGCGIPDATSPSGVGGIDNALASLLPFLEATEAAALEPLIAAAIREGGLMMVLRWAGIDDPDFDTCVTVDAMSGLPPVLVGANGVLLPSQTIDIDGTAPTSSVVGGTIEDGVLSAGPFALTIPFRVLDADIDLVLRDVRIELTPDGEDQWRGIVGGGVDVADILTSLEPLAIDGTLKAALGGLLGNAADLAPDASGACTRLSAQIAIEAVPVFLYEPQ
ncbi:MAG: hypothetical protein RLZZ383_2583 [Pseudomonadota bacterium]|jgi:hypothetical protein